MHLTGQNFIGNTLSSKGNETFKAVNPNTTKELETVFTEATSAEVDLAVQKAEQAFPAYSGKSQLERADFLDAIADEILGLGDTLIKRCMAESGLPEGRLTGERGRTMGQLKLFANLLRDGSWVDARIETAIPDRQPFPKPDVRSMEKALGPVGIFGASNFPLAFSVAGGDTASALAAGCTIVVKGHPAHPGTSELVALAITNAIKKTNMPDGTFSMVHGKSVAVGMAIVEHPLIKAIGFTGSYRGGTAIYAAASKRPEPIPVYAEMGSTNPVFILPNALKEKTETIASGLAGSITLGVGQFCTNPGLVILQEGDSNKQFQDILATQINNIDAGTMLTEGIQKAYANGAEHLSKEEGVALLAAGNTGDTGYTGTPQVLNASAKSLLGNKTLEEEVFGPSSMIITATSKSELLETAKNLSGHLTATLFGTDEDLEANKGLLALLERKVGRLIINAFPTGVEVCHAMVHGGPFPATTDSRSTSVGTGAITRFTRPVCYQGFPDTLLPDELKNNNPKGVWRLVNGERTKAN